MEVTGSRFTFDVPASWRLTEDDPNGRIVVTSDEKLLGFTPTVELREWNLRWSSRDSLAATSLDRIQALTAQQMLLQVEAIPDDNAHPDIRERRRLWILSPPEAAGTETGEDPSGLLIIRDLLVTDPAVAELTATVPLLAWRRGDVHETILSSLRPYQHSGAGSLFSRRRRGPADTITIGSAHPLDTHITRRDGLPRESLERPGISPVHDQVSPSGFTLSEEIAEISVKAFEVFDDLALLGRLTKSPRWSSAGRGLVRAGLIDRTGAATAQGERLIRHLRDGHRLAFKVDASPPQEVVFWIHGRDALAVFSFVGLGTRALGFCPAARIPYMLLDLLSFFPSWGLSFTCVLPRSQFLAKLLSDVPPTAATGGDAIEFAQQRWVPIALLGPEEEPVLEWVMTPHRGAAIMHTRTDTNEITLTSDPRTPFWLLFLDASARLVQGENLTAGRFSGTV